MGQLETLSDLGFAAKNNIQKMSHNEIKDNLNLFVVVDNIVESFISQCNIDYQNIVNTLRYISGIA